MMPRMTRGAGRVGAAVAVLALVAGCGSGADPGPGGDDPTSTAEGAWRESSEPVPTDGLVWAAEHTVHLGDGSTTVGTGAPISTYVVAGDGVFFVAAESEAKVATAGAEVREVQFAAPGDDPVGTGLELQADTLVASPDGRYVGGIDMVSGEQDAFGTPVAVVRVFDLRSGEEVLSTSERMGDPGADDLAVLYEDVSIGLQLSDDTAYVDEAEGDWAAYPLPSGAPEPLPDGPPGFGADPLRSPDGSAVIVRDRLRDRVELDDGGVTVPDPGTARWILDGWLDDSTVFGIAVDGPGGRAEIDSRDRTELLSCEVPGGRCTVVPESAGAFVQLPAGSPTAGFQLQAGEG